jgi:hypothetical protein
MLPEAMLVGEMLRREVRRVGERRWRMGDRDPLVASGILHGDGVRQTLESDCQPLGAAGRGEAAMKGAARSKMHARVENIVTYGRPMRESGRRRTGWRVGSGK